MKRILPYIFGFRALLVIVVILISLFGFSDRGNAEPTPTPTPTPTATEPPPEPLPTLCSGLADPDENCTVEVQLTDSQLDHVLDGATGFAWGMGVLVFCGIVTAIAAVRGNRT